MVQMNLKLFLVSFLVGVVDSLPGVSGGTVAFVGGIYERLLTSLNNIIQTRSVGDIIAYDWEFISIFGTMVLFGAYVMFSFLSVLLSLFSHVVYLVFALIILCCVCYIFYTEGLSYGHCFVMLIVSLPVYFFSQLIFQIGELPFYAQLVVGIICGIAMLLPGISGSFVLLMFGQYEFVSAAVKRLDLFYLLPFSFGFMLGVLLCSHVVSIFLRKNRMMIISVLLGIMVGTVPVLT